jgi:hypothetical protein
MSEDNLPRVIFDSPTGIAPKGEGDGVSVAYASRTRRKAHPLDDQPLF